MNIAPKKIQAIIFLKSTYFSGTDKLTQINEFKSKLQDASQFSEPIVLPVLDEMPLEIPRFVMNSKSSVGYAVNGSANRVDVFSDYSGETNDYESFIELVKKIFDSLKITPKCNRLALIVTYQNNSSDPLSEIKAYFASNNVPEEISEYHTAFNSRETFDDLKVNRFIKSDYVDTGSQKIANLQLDINTVPETVSDISDIIFNTFFEKAKEMNGNYLMELTNE